MTEGNFPAFSSVETEGFKKLFNVADSKLTVKSRHTFSRKVEAKHQNIMKEVCEIVSSCKPEMQSLAITNDCWTSRSNDAYISLTLHFIDNQFYLHRWTKNVSHFPGKHTGERIEAKIEDMMDPVDIPDDIPLISVNDNASNVKLAIALSRFNEYNCCNHSLQLAITDAFKEVEGMTTALNCCKSLSSYTNRCSTALQLLKEECEKLGIDFTVLLQQIPTRWDSQLLCMQSVLKLKEAIISLSMRNEEFSARCPSFNQWKLIEGAVEILQPFREKVPTINTVTERLFTMTTYLKDFIKNKNKCRYGITFARTLLTCTEERFPDCGTESIENSAANFLSPHYKGIHLTLFNRFDSTS